MNDYSYRRGVSRLGKSARQMARGFGIIGNMGDSGSGGSVFRRVPFGVIILTVSGSYQSQKMDSVVSL